MQRLIPAAAALLAGALSLLSFVQTIELQTYDLRVNATAHASAPANDVVLIAIDNDSIRRMDPYFGRWPWPRLVHGQVIDFLAAAGAKVIGYDIPSPSATFANSRSAAKSGQAKNRTGRWSNRRRRPATSFTSRK